MSYLQEQRNGIRIDVQIQPRAPRDEIVGIHGNALKIRFKAPPVDGKANAALIALLAKKLGIAKSSIMIVRGETSRRKCLIVRDADACLIHNLLA